MKEKVRINHLATGKPSQLYFDIKGKLGFSEDYRVLPFGRKNQHLYFTSYRDLEVGDYVLSKLYGLGKVVSDNWADKDGKTPMLVQFKEKAIMFGKDGSYKDDGNKIYDNDCYKIVATNDTSLWEHDDMVPYPKTRPALPKIQQSFLKNYAKADGKIDEVEVEFHEIYIDEKTGNQINYFGYEFDEAVHEGLMVPKKIIKIKVDLNNCVSTHPVKDSWNRKDCVDNIKNFAKHFVANADTEYWQKEFDEWIEKNL